MSSWDDGIIATVKFLRLRTKMHHPLYVIANTNLALSTVISAILSVGGYVDQGSKYNRGTCWYVSRIPVSFWIDGQPSLF
jgi:hypothetical protein